MKPEARFRANMVKALRNYGALAQPIESEGTGRGIPDLYIAHGGVIAWIECKDDSTGIWPCDRKIAFRPLQYSWGKKNESEGGISIVAIHYLNGYLFTHIHDVDASTMRPSRSASLFQEHFSAQGLLQWLKACSYTQKEETGC